MKTMIPSKHPCFTLKVAQRIAIAAAMTLGGTARAASDTWIGNSVVNWNSGEWSPTNTPPLAGDILLFGAAGSAGSVLNNDLVAGFALGGITFNPGASPYVINGNAITLNGNIVNAGTVLETINLPIELSLSGTNRIFTTAANGADLNLGGVISGAGGIMKTGAGTLTLANTANTFTGETLIGTGGILNVASLSDYGVASSIGARLQSAETAVGSGIGIHIQGGTLQYTGSTAQSTNREIRIFNGATGATIDASGSTPAATLSFTHTGANTNLFDTGGARTLILTGTNTGANSFSIRLTDQSTNQTSLAKAGTGTWFITNTDNTYTGETIFRGGILNVASLSDYGVPSSIGARPLSAENTTVTGISLHFQGGTLQYTGSTPQSTNREIRFITGNGATIDASGSNPAATLSFTHTGVNKNLYDTAGTRTLTLTGTNTGANSFSIALTDLSSVNTTSLTKTGSGTWVLNGPDTNSNTGVTTVNAGILSLAKSAALAISGNVAIGDGSANAVVLLGGPGGNQIADSSIATFKGAGATAGTLRMNNFDETVGGINSTGGEGIIENESGAAGTGTLTINVPNNTQDYSGVLRDGDGIGTDGVLAITKTGAGTLILSGVSTHTGPTLVKAGTLTVTGTLSAGSAINVTNATLDGSGTIAGAVTVANGGILGSSGTVTGNVNLTAGGILNGIGTLLGITTAGSGSRISPGTATTPGALTLTSLVLSSGSLLDFEFGAGASDMINVTGGLTLNGGAFNIFEAGGVTPLTTNGTYSLIDYSTNFAGLLSNLSIGNSQVGKFYSISNNTANTVIQLTIADTALSAWTGQGANNRWSTAANWSGGVPDAAGAVARFGSVATAPAVTVDGAKTVGGMLFDNTAAINYTVSGGAADIITLNNGVASASISVTGGNQVITAPIVLATAANATTVAGTTLTLSGNLSGAKSFTASGAGTTILTGTNTFTLTTVIGGTLQIGDNGTTGTLGSGDVTVAAGGLLVFNRSDDLVVANNIFGSNAQVTKLGAGTLTLNGNNAFSTAAGGGFNLNAGTVKLGNASALAPGVILSMAGGTLDLNANNVSVGALSGDTGTITDSAKGVGTTLLAINQTGDSTFGGAILDGTERSLGITKSGPGALTLTGTNNFKGPFAITNGAVIAAGLNGAPISSNIVTLGDGNNAVALIAGAAGSQFAPDTVVSFTNGAKDAKLMLRGTNQTLAGIDAAVPFNTTLAIIQNDEVGSAGYTGVGGDANLTLNTVTDHSFTGLIRNQAGGALNLIKEGPATQEIRNALVVADNFGSATINAGKLTFNFTPNGNGTNVLGAATTILVNSGGTLGLDGAWNMARPISGTGTVLKQGTGAITLSATNSGSFTTILSEGTLTAAAATGPSLAGNVTIGTGTQAGIFLIAGAANQFGPESVLSFNNGTGRDAKFELRGFSQTVAGLSSDADDTLSIIQNQESGTPVAATLTINATNDYVFNGLIRTQSTGGLLSLVKEGPGTQEIRNVAAAPLNFGNATINAGKLTFNLSGVNNTLGANTSILINNSAVLGLDGTWTMSRPVSGSGTVLKQGTGIVTVTSALTQTGGTMVNDGTLLVGGSISGSVNVSGATAIVGGGGSVGALTIQNGGTVAPGNNAPGILTATSDVTFNAGTSLRLEINNTTAGTGYDQLNITGAVALGSSTLSLSGTYLASSANNDLFFVLLNDGAEAISGIFNGAPEGSIVSSDIGQKYLLTYKADAGSSSFIGGNDIALMAVPEPNSIFSLLAGCGLLLGVRRHRRTNI